MDWKAFDAARQGGATGRDPVGIDFGAIQDCEARLDPTAPRDYRALAARLAEEWKRTRPRCIGLAGGQGAGKTTLGRLIERACGELGLRACIVALDDFYLSRDARRTLAARVHPLFETRGPPGTHDVLALDRALEALLAPGEVTMPTFDKGRDDCGTGVRVRGPFDLVVLEGWCVGAPPGGRSELVSPANALEAEEDPEGTWRNAVEAELAGPYGSLWRRLDALVFLAVPGIEAVRRWRLEQETERDPEQRLDAPAVTRFVAHYERITRRMLERLPESADWTIRLAEDHGVAAIDPWPKKGLPR
jgi:D-glycerate 3-kinase